MRERRPHCDREVPHRGRQRHRRRLCSRMRSSRPLSQVFEAAINRFGGSVGGARAVEVRQDVGGAEFRCSAVVSPFSAQ